MPPYEKEANYFTRTASFKNVSGDGTTAADTDLVVIEFDHMSQVSNIRITGASSQIYDVVVRDQDASNPEVVYTVVGSDIDDGTFRNPAVRNMGAQKEVAIINRDQLADSNYGVNLEVDQMRRRKEA